MIDRKGGAEPDPTSTTCSASPSELATASRVASTLPVIHLQQVARYRAVSRQQDRAHQIGVVRKRAGDVRIS